MVHSAVNFVFSIRPSYFEPLSELFPETHVQHGLESLYKLDSIGISDDSEPSDYDLARIEEFKRGVELRAKNIMWSYHGTERFCSKFPMVPTILWS
jgi:hypothetical protein